MLSLVFELLSDFILDWILLVDPFDLNFDSRFALILLLIVFFEISELKSLLIFKLSSLILESL